MKFCFTYSLLQQRWPVWLLVLALLGQSTLVFAAPCADPVLDVSTQLISDHQQMSAADPHHKHRQMDQSQDESHDCCTEDVTACAMNTALSACVIAVALELPVVTSANSIPEAAPLDLQTQISGLYRPPISG